MTNKEAVLDYIEKHINLHTNGLHGISHWQRVEKFGEFLAKMSGADPEVLELFAYTHDLGRLRDDEDPEHGLRSAKIVEDLYKKGIIKISYKQYQQLVYACANHMITFASSSDVTIQACWDADRLDLWRANIEPNPEFLYTESAKQSATIIWAKSLLSDLSF
jgi:uncharacterized protein